ncbi:hypothetical protein [Spirochaeta thermophila]|uniref:Uncharacterized protein n=1 Tax=Winmispira thermophila (strain ATCC 49972 / DSM 6192 / RI 19.B1) TaxID=665571 RepID=E0RR14_WINT6|nr:hypothetical protein [Spirochaeta thermophila]ADN01592.1 hypothetical protein STHERM_c06330 [Spirochaeta thermophila DSM 6192]
MECLVILDYSGTVSLESVRFGTEERLRKALEESGLAALEVTPSFLWKQVIETFWDRASKGGITYVESIVRALGTVCEAPEAQREQAARAFVRSYLRASTVDPVWARFLRIAGPHLPILIATDHYLEAEQAILAHLEDEGIAARPWPDASEGCMVACSARIGARKEETTFWEEVRRAYGSHPRVIHLVDDFGANEAPARRHPLTRRLQGRIERISTALLPLEAREVTIHPFVLPRLDDEDRAADTVRSFVRSLADTLTAEGFLPKDARERV